MMCMKVMKVDVAVAFAALLMQKGVKLIWDHKN